MRNTTFKISKREVPSIYDHMQHFKKLITEKDSVMLTVYCVQIWILQKVFQFCLVSAARDDWCTRSEKKNNNNEESRFNFHIVSTRF